MACWLEIIQWKLKENDEDHRDIVEADLPDHIWDNINGFDNAESPKGGLMGGRGGRMGVILTNSRFYYLFSWDGWHWITPSAKRQPEGAV